MINIRLTGDIDQVLTTLAIPREGELLTIGLTPNLRKFIVVEVIYHFPLNKDDSCNSYIVFVREI